MSGFYGRPETWGIVVQTIRSGPARFTCMTTFGHWIAMACSDGVVRIYRAVTGALRLSLEPKHSTKVIAGSPDGSILCCAHLQNSVTLWDIQTGGSICTFSLVEEIEEIAISTKGRFLACGFASGLVDVLEVTNEVDGTGIWEASPVADFCWLGLEEQLLIVGGVWVQIWDVVAGTTLCSFTVVDPIHAMVYSQELNQLAIATISPSQSTVVIIDPQTGIPSALPEVQGSMSCFAFSPATKEFMCGMQKGGLEVFSFSTQCWTRLVETENTLAHVAPLANGTVVVAESAHSDIRVLGLGDGYTSSPQLALASGVKAFDQGRFIAITSTTHDHIQLLEASTMRELFTIPTRYFDSTKSPTILSASPENRMFVYYFGGAEEAGLALHKFGDELPKWTVKTESLPSACRISPAGTWLVTIHHSYFNARVCVWETGNGQLQAQLPTDTSNTSLDSLSDPSPDPLSNPPLDSLSNPSLDSLPNPSLDSSSNPSSPPPDPLSNPPLDSLSNPSLDCSSNPSNPSFDSLHELTLRPISSQYSAGVTLTFDSETRFYSHHENHRVPYDLNFSPGGRTTYTIIRHKQQPWTVESRKRGYEVDTRREWVVSDSKRIFWIPPG